jgi:hypothetical protein
MSAVPTTTRRMSAVPKMTKRMSAVPKTTKRDNSLSLGAAALIGASTIAANVIRDTGLLEDHRAIILAYLLVAPFYYWTLPQPRFRYRIFILRVASYGVVLLIGLTTLPVLFARWMTVNPAQALAIFLITASFYWAPPLMPQKRWHPSLWLWLLGCLACALLFGWLLH